ncbi:hypothetical protein E8E11_003539 [Didymella keratinophila]|nr:hypothetical protein E8E11_003539 [Didymella keratinophila]
MGSSTPSAPNIPGSHCVRTVSHTKKLFSRLTSLRGRRTYDRLDDEELSINRRRLNGLEEGDESLEILHGSSSVVPMKQIDPSQYLHSTASSAEQQQDLNEAGYIAEYERLESRLGLGAGMKSIFERPFTHVPAPVGPGSYARQPRGEPAVNITAIQARNAQEEAEKTGDIVAVAEIPVDISDSFGGADFETRNGLAKFTKADDLTLAEFFTWKYAPIIAFVFYGILWQMTDFEVKRLEPYYQLSPMATRSHILTDFHGLDEAPLEKIHKQLRHRRYILHKSSLWQGEYIRNAKQKMHEHSADPRPLMLRLIPGVSFVSFIVVFTGAIPVFTFVEATSVVTDKLPFLLTGIATIVRILWNTMNCDIRMLQPFYILSKRHAPAKTLTLDYAGTNPLFLPIIALFNRHWLVALVAFGSVLAEVLTVCVSSINVDGTRFFPGMGKDDDDIQDGNDRHNQEQTFRSFWISLTLSFLILLYLISVAILTYMRRSHKFMPRQIGTMASVLAMIYQSKMLLTFVDTEKLTSSQMTKHLEKQEKRYALGWFKGRDGDHHLGIDEEPILDRYVYGEKYRDMRLLGHQIGTWEQY